MWGTNMPNVGTRYYTKKSLYLEAAVLFPSKKVLEFHDPDLQDKEIFDVEFDPFESVNRNFPYDEVSNKPRSPGNWMSRRQTQNRGYSGRLCRCC
jgi:hypothetical protein